MDNKTVPEIRNITIYVEPNGKNIPVTSVSGEVTVDELLSAISEKIKLPFGTSCYLIRRITRKELLLNETLNQAGIQDGEMLIFDYVRTAGGHFEFYPDGKVKHIETIPEETQFLADILREIRLLYETIGSLEKAVTEIKAEIKEIQNSTIVITGNDASVKRNVHDKGDK